MPSQLKSQARFEDFPLTFDNYSWLHQSRWSNSEVFWHKNQQMQPFLQIFCPPSHLHPKRTDIESSSDTWVLTDNRELKPLASLALQMFKGQNFNRGYVYVRISDEIVGESGYRYLAALVRLIFLVGRIDQVYFLGEASLFEFFSRFVGQSKVVFSLPLNPWMAPQAKLSALSTLIVSRQEWLSCPEISSLSTQHTSYLESRLARQEAAHKLASKRTKKRGLIARILRPRIDDSIF